MSLDAAPDALHEALQQMEALTVAYYEHLDGRRVFHGKARAPIRAAFAEPLPQKGMSLSALVERFEADVLDAALQAASPNMFGYVISSGNHAGMLAGMLTEAVPLCGGKWHVNAAQAEIAQVVIRWLAEFIGYDPSCGGVITSGGTTANLLCLAAARDAKAPFDVRQVGLSGGPALVVYASTETHISIDKAVAALGLGTQHLRKIPVGPDFRIDTGALETQIEADQAAGLHPFCVVGNGGATNTGAVDPLDRLADICERRGLWFHVDAAYGGPAAATSLAGPLFAGLERADSVTIDPHKWLFVPVEAGCVLVKDARHLQRSFATNPDYLAQDRGSEPVFDLHEHDLQLTRSFKELKVWMTFKAYGAEALRDAVEDNIRVMRRFAQRVEKDEMFELLAPAPLSAVCFRYRPAKASEWSEVDLDRLNTRILRAVEQDGRVFLSGTKIHDRVALRACCINHRASQHHADYLFDVLRDLGYEEARKVRTGARSVVVNPT